ncbi:hypothetical protein [Luteibacter anthropi]|uniref:Uncharacterized protein n=1 Tax=Luteibacter anthropi TaxID=564369 RepID=A0A7X5U6Y3_9GAMM|nr:hypothetical protein [Luteibacter anthropi]NII05038.1 hypothetical protein [Luteibacter anthropi]
MVASEIFSELFVREFLLGRIFIEQVDDLGVNWTAGLMRWAPHRCKENKSYPLNHLHPFKFDIELPATSKMEGVVVNVHVGFGLHCFTRKILPGDCESERYGDDREQRTFCRERYALSKGLRAVVESLKNRQCGFAKDDNYVTVDVTDVPGQSIRYGVFFNVKRWRERGASAVLLVVQSAYALDHGKAAPMQGKIRLNVLLGHALRGTKPKRGR